LGSLHGPPSLFALGLEFAVARLKLSEVSVGSLKGVLGIGQLLRGFLFERFVIRLFDQRGVTDVAVRGALALLLEVV
jgi:hypothetical protein